MSGAGESTSPNPYCLSPQLLAAVRARVPKAAEAERRPQLSYSCLPSLLAQVEAQMLAVNRNVAVPSGNNASYPQACVPHPAAVGKEAGAGV